MSTSAQRLERIMSGESDGRVRCPTTSPECSHAGSLELLETCVNTCPDGESTVRCGGARIGAPAFTSCGLKEQVLHRGLHSRRLSWTRARQCVALVKLPRSSDSIGLVPAPLSERT